MLNQNMFKFWLFLVAALFLHQNGLTQQTGEDDLINSVFGTAQEGKPKNCECVEYYLCENGTINTDGENIIDVRESVCDDYLEVCCQLTNIKEGPPEIVTPRPTEGTCGVRNTNGQSFKLVNSDPHDAEYTEFPWMVALLKVQEQPKEFIYKCGGSLIHPRVVITAAHCVTNKKDKFVVRAGEWDTQRTSEQYPTQDRDVQSIKIHPEFYSGALYNDIAILVMASPFKLAPNVDVICLPEQNMIIPESTRCVVSGWGLDVYGKKGVYKAILKKVDVPIVEKNTCRDNLRKTRLGQRFSMHSSFLCAGGEAGRDSCTGDGGSPLACPLSEHSDVYYLAGIVSWGIGCGVQNVPGVYVNVPLVKNWISQEMQQMSL